MLEPYEASLSPHAVEVVFFPSDRRYEVLQRTTLCAGKELDKNVHSEHRLQYWYE